MSELNREQIMSKLEWYRIASLNVGACTISAEELNSIIGLILELTEENERLNRVIDETNESMKEAKNSLAVIHTGVVNLIAENERLRADTVREMCQRIKEYFPYDADSGLYVVLDQIAKEMLEGENEN